MFFFFLVRKLYILTITRMSFYAKFAAHAMTIANRIKELTLLAREYIITIHSIR